MSSQYKVAKNSTVNLNGLNFETVILSVRAFIVFSILFHLPQLVIASNSSASPEVSVFQERGKYGLKDKKGEVLIPALYEALGWSSGEFAVVDNVIGYRQGGKWGLISVQNRKITKAEFLSLRASSPLIIAGLKPKHTLHELFGCLTPAGKVIIPIQYDRVKLTSLRAIVMTRAGREFKTGLIDFDNRVLIPIAYHDIYPIGSLRFAVINGNNKTGIFSEDGHQITEFVIDSISAFRRDIAVYYQNQLKGLIDREGRIITEAIYRDIHFSDEGIMGRRPNHWKFLSGINESLNDFFADSVEAIHPKIYKVQIAEQIQLMDKTFKPVTQTNITWIEKFKNGKARFRNEKGMGIIRANGEVMLQPEYLDVRFSPGVIRASKRTELGIRWTLTDSSGALLTQKSYDFIGDFNGGFFPVRQRKYWGGIDSKGREIIACVHDSIVQFKSNRVSVKFKGAYGVINKEEQWLVPPQPDPVQILSSERYLLLTPENKFIRSMKGEIIYFTSNPIELRDDHIIELLPSGKIWKINFEGKVSEQGTSAAEFEKSPVESEGFRAIKKDGRYGFVDSRMRLRIANRYEDVQGFKEGLAPVKILGRWGFINKQDNIAIQPVYDRVSQFNAGTAFVERDNKKGVIDKTGKIVIPLRYNEIIALPDNRFLIGHDNVYGLVDANGKTLLNTKYSLIRDLNNGYIIVGQNKKYGVVTLEGVSTIPLIYDSIIFDPFANNFLCGEVSEWQKITLK